MTKADVMSKLQEVFDNVFVEEVKVTEELSANDVNEWDSLSHITLIVSVEKAFKVRFGIGEVEATNNVGDLADLIVKKLGTV
ncbi:MAG: acyl carrier protein [Candidatus Obscuribacterales bacterium]|nr:acyl carrier protein [Candidatus Obscuribacterales bacterium]